MTWLALLSALVWSYLLLGHGRFWQAGPILSAPRSGLAPGVAVVVPARDEAATIEACLRSLLAQDYAGAVEFVLVDDGSTDDTGAIARSIGDARLRVVEGRARPAGWSGKLWAVEQGVAATCGDLVLLTDADIVHAPGHLAALVAQADNGPAGVRLDLVSEVVALTCDSPAERALLPAFVYFFQMLYPFAWVNDPLRATAAAAGGTMLVRRSALMRIGGIAAIGGALIDDVALARGIKRGGGIWLGHATMARSLRPYPGAGDIWRMVARTAFVQLRHSWWLLD